MDPRKPLEISYSLQLLNAGIALEDANRAAQILYQDHFRARTSEEQGIIQRVWKHLWRSGVRP